MATRDPDQPASGLATLNAKRAHAVRLRLSGMKISHISNELELSRPTVIAACKAYASGGWEAVPVRPRGREPGMGRTLNEGCERKIFDMMLTSTPDRRGLSSLLWDIEAVQSLVTGCLATPLHPRTIRQYLRRWGFDQGMSASLGTEASALARSARRRGAAMHWLSVDPIGVKPSIGGAAATAPAMAIQAVSGRGTRRWLALPAMPKPADLIEFLDRLSRQSGRALLLVSSAFDLARNEQVRTWLGTQQGRIEFVHLGARTPVRSPLACPDQDTTANDRAPRLAPAAGAFDNDRGILATMRMATRSLPGPAPLQNAAAAPPALTHLRSLEAEAIHILREAVAEAERPVMLYSIGKDSSVLLHLARKAFYPGTVPFPLLHIDTTWKFREMYAFRDQVRDSGVELLVHVNAEGLQAGINPFQHGSEIHTDVMKTRALKQALASYGFDAAIGGARRDEEKSRAKERVFSFRDPHSRWDPRRQRPELWRLYNTRKRTGESFRVFPLSNWSEPDVWQYIRAEAIPIVPLYFAKERPVVERDGLLIVVDDERMPLAPSEIPTLRKVRFRTLGCYPLTAAIDSDADTLDAVIAETLAATTSERNGRIIDRDSTAAMEKKKQEGYF